MFAFAASDLILAAITAALGIVLFWVVGHEVEKDVSAIGHELLDPALKAIANPLTLAGVVLAIYFITVRGRK